MGVQKKTRKFAVAKRTIQLRDSRLSVGPELFLVTLSHFQGSSYSLRNRKANDKTAKDDKARQSGKDEVVREA